MVCSRHSGGSKDWESYGRKGVGGESGLNVLLTRLLRPLESNTGLSAGMADIQKKVRRWAEICMTERSGCWKHAFIFLDLGKSVGRRKGWSHGRDWSIKCPSGCGAHTTSLRAAYREKGISQGTRRVSWAGLQWRLSQLQTPAPSCLGAASHGTSTPCPDSFP